MGEEALRADAGREAGGALALPRFQPLYRQVAETLRERVRAGVWKPGDALPSEPRLAETLGVSQGTLRKALDALEAESLVERHQGRGTFIARQTRERALFQFFRLRADGDERSPEALGLASRVLACRVQRASRAQATALGLGPGERVHSLIRLRALGGEPAIHERVAVPLSIVARLEVPLEGEMEEELYELYQRLAGLHIARVSERLKAVAADQAEAEALGIPAGTPLLEIDRTAIDLEGRPVEWRLSRCLTEAHHYRNDLG